MLRTKGITLCADDYGYSEAVNAGILDLIEKKRLNATSCMTNMPFFEAGVPALKALRSQAEIGLHFNLTEGKPLSGLPALHFGPLSQLLLFSHLRLLKKIAIQREFEAQLDAFEKAFGCTPDFIDGHQHVHHLPVIRDAILAVYAKRFPDKKVWLRVSSNPLSDQLKALFKSPKSLIITLTGALSLKRQLQKSGIPFNTRFSGAYDFREAKHYAEHFSSFVKAVNGAGLIMCHPAKAMGALENDVIFTARVEEYRFFSEHGSTVDAAERA